MIVRKKMYKTQHVFKVPQDVLAIYCDRKNILLLKGCFGRTIVLKLKNYLLFSSKTKTITPSKIFTDTKSAKFMKKQKNLNNVYFSNLKRCVLNLSLMHCKQLNLVGVGYKMSLIDIGSSNVLNLKLGYSHLTYHRLIDTKTLIKKKKIFFFSNNFLALTNTVSKIRDYKFPDCYKGKGFVYEGEIIELKEGKKT